MVKLDERVIVRMSRPLSNDLFRLIFSRYPGKEWGSFIRLGFHETKDNLIMTLHSIDSPVAKDLEENSWITEIQAQYTSRILRNAEKHPYALGFVHSHPKGWLTSPSASDLAMEKYYAELLKPYTNDRPFASLVFAEDDNQNLSATGRVHWKGKWHKVDRFIIEGKYVTKTDYKQKMLSSEKLKRIARLASQFSERSAEHLAASVVGVVGASGTGSPCIELLARAGIGKLVVVDPEIFSDSNLERIHGSFESDIKKELPKVVIAGRHIKSINPDCEVVLIEGRVPQSMVVNELLKCDLVLGCTDLHSARVSLSDLSLRYLLPIIDVGVIMEGKDGKITGQVIQINRLFPKDPCVYCRGMVDSVIVDQELMPPEEQARRRKEAKRAQKEGREPNLYWKDIPQLNTVGFLTTLAGSMVMSYTIGYLTGSYGMVKNRIELNLSQHGIQIAELNETFDTECRCRKNIGTGDQEIMAVMSSAPAHWKEPKVHKAKVAK
jgi:molybdopterin/thiamine biosynthesis adenylyltransferase